MNDAELKVVKPQEILAEEGGKISLAPLQRVGVRGAFIVGAVATGVLMIRLVRWLWLEPAMPNVPAGMDEKQVAAIMSRYKELQSIHRQHGQDDRRRDYENPLTSIHQLRRIRIWLTSRQ